MTMEQASHCASCEWLCAQGCCEALLDLLLGLFRIARCKQSRSAVNREREQVAVEFYELGAEGSQHKLPYSYPDPFRYWTRTYVRLIRRTQHV